MIFPRQEYWGGLPFPCPGDLPDLGIGPVSPALRGGFFLSLIRQESAFSGGSLFSHLCPPSVFFLAAYVYPITALPIVYSLYIFLIVCCPYCTGNSRGAETIFLTIVSLS